MTTTTEETESQATSQIWVQDLRYSVARKDVLKRGRREWTISGMVSLMLAMLSSTGVGLIAMGTTLGGWAVLAVAAVAIAAIFAFVEMKEIAFAE